MHGNTEPPARVVADDPGAESDYRKRILCASAKLFLATQVLGHRRTHETEKAVGLIEEATRVLGVERIEVAEGERRSEGVGPQDGEAA